ncbi:SAM hydrolase/SAM-dependent halogenase family protein [Desulfonema magnum]|uniref:SAM-dependent hydroxide adenosyltransferase n=1 Tax=Desulfonema magnum TaxID=45655 RepID=A0A975GT70_9BACT|nr:SAM-dependent chlorinase/fluorinase [Desulfonema magnum]QTA91813.1 SAM-dependent hydroxide adenosyltransferase [Desulfonema magnum]
MVITLLTDFGTDDEYVGVMKGVILSLNPAATIIDITHSIDPQDLTHAAHTLESSYQYFPKGTVHVIVVDPGVGSGRAILAVKTKKYVFLAPDNGVLTRIMDSEIINSVIRVDKSEYFLESVSQTFHGRDIFAPVAAHITRGVQIKQLGTPEHLKNLVRLRIPKPYISDSGELVGTIVSADRFGNLITNIDLNTLATFCREQAEAVSIRIGKNEIIGLSQSYASVKSQNPLAIMSSRGYLEISVNCGNARQHFRVGKGDTVTIKRHIQI